MSGNKSLFQAPERKKQKNRFARGCGIGVRCALSCLGTVGVAVGLCSQFFICNFSAPKDEFSSGIFLR